MREAEAEIRTEIDTETEIKTEMETEIEKEIAKREKQRYRILIFGGTIEGRQVSDYLLERRVMHTVCVATEYGAETARTASENHFMTIHQGRMDAQQMCAFLQKGSYALVVDATHPYAVEVSKNIREACEKECIPCLRYLRPTPGDDETPADPCFASDAVYVDSAREAAEYLEKRQGGIFLTTGSKELHLFTETITEKNRLFARVLPSAEVVASCRALGLEGRQICAMQGPFSADLNLAMLRQTGAAFLVTKDTGASGGFPEKIEAAHQCGVLPVIIRRPEETGYGWEEVKARLDALISGEETEKAQSEELAAEKETEKAQPEALAAEKETEKALAAGKETEKAQPEELAAGKETEKAQPEELAVGKETEKAQPQKISESEEKSSKIRGDLAVSCIGIGMGTPDTLTQEALREICEAQVLFGANRVLESARKALKCDAMCGTWITEYSAARIYDWLAAHREYTKAAILMSGDIGFYSGARQVAEIFPANQVRYYCGISSVAYFASKIPTSWQDAKLLSAHGKELALLNYVKRYRKIILLVSGASDVERYCRELAEAGGKRAGVEQADGERTGLELAGGKQTGWTEAGLDRVLVTVGSNLSYPEETIQTGAPDAFLSIETSGLHIMMIENPDAGEILTPGIPDDAFVRGKVPMTKEEIRALSVAKLRLLEDSVVYDIGAGTGSVSIECARLCTDGSVYAIERNPEGIALIRENRKRFAVANLFAVEGTAPETLRDLPTPTHAFIGGSSGNMREIIETLRRKNPDVRIVINTVTMETIAEVMDLIRELSIEDADIVQVSAAKSRPLGRYHMMTAHNPVYIISFGGEGDIREVKPA